MLKFALGKLDELVVGHVPHFVALGDKVFHSETGGVLVGEHVFGPVFKILNAPDMNVGGVDVNPVVGKELGDVEDEDDGEKITIAETVGGMEDIGRGRRLDGVDEVAEGKGGDECVAGDGVLGAVIFIDDTCDAHAVAVDAGDGRVQEDLAAAFADAGGECFPHHAGTEARIFKFFDEGFDATAVLKDCAFEGRGEGKPANALGSPFGAYFGTGDAPHFFGVGHEKDAIEAASKTV